MIPENIVSYLPNYDMIAKKPIIRGEWLYAGLSQS